MEETGEVVRIQIYFLLHLNKYAYLIGPEPTSRSGLGDLKDEIDQERAKKRDRSRDRDRDRRRDRSRDRRDRSRSRGRRDRDRGGREPREDRMKEERSYEEEGGRY